ncbi:MAG: zinc ABC transporter substrate-binding protein [Thermoleophilaceae bacterium]|nr:zinc ABC transporter substrate-binding protein [Thermoleophilaceae bacterium]
MQVSATTTQVADLVRNVAGDRAEVNGILPPNADPHDYEPRPSDVAALGEAAVVFKSGGDLDLFADQLIEAGGGDGEVVALLDRVTTIEGGDDHEGEEEHAEDAVDPHWWQDPRNAVVAVEAIRDALITADPGGAETYETNAADYLDELETLDDQIAGCIGELAPERRKLVTEHDALGYYADRYGLEIIGTTIPALTTQARPSAGDTAALVDLIRSEDVPVIFPESALNPKLATAIAAEADATVGEPLYADTLGPADSEGATYIGAMRANTATIVSGLSGGALGCEGQ